MVLHKLSFNQVSAVNTPIQVKMLCIISQYTLLLIMILGSSIKVGLNNNQGCQFCPYSTYECTASFLWMAGKNIFFFFVLRHLSHSYL